MMLRFFNIEEFACSHTGNNFMDEDFLLKLDELRAICGFPFVITSGFRDPTHPVEAKKRRPGRHSEGIAADIKVNGSEQRYILSQKAFELGFTGIGIAKTFVHVDTRDSNPAMWTY